MHPAKVFLPFHFAIEIEAIEAARTEESVKLFTVGDGRIGSKAAGYVTTLVRPLFAQGFRPQYTPVATADGEREKLVAMSDRHAVVNARGIVVDRLLRVAPRHNGPDVNRIAENY